MDDKKILQHLLDLERQAAALVGDAQEEAARRMSEGEKQNRLHSEEFYARELEVLEKAYIGNNNAVKESYRKQLDEYRESLNTQTANLKAFCNLAEKFLIGSGQLNGEL